jgi:two-component system response regulator GlrR
LRFLQEKEFRPLGSSKVQFADVRVLAATNLDPEKAIEEGHLRRDLYYRLNTLPINLPPLRSRKEDIPLLLNHFLDKYISEYSRKNLSLGQDALSRLSEYSWPGNIRELEQVVQRAVLLASGPILGADDFQLRDRVDPIREKLTFQSAKSQVIRVFERNYIENLLKKSRGNISRAAAAAGKNRRAFWQLLQKHGITSDSYREP